MKKRLLLSLTAFAAALSVNAQTTLQVGKRSERSETVKKSNSVEKQVAGTLICNTQYVAGTTMDLNFTLELTNTDFEYCDLFSITFPTGITPNTSANNTDPIYVATENQADEVLNPISGQTISWGDDDDTYGGIEAGFEINFTVNVTIAGGTTGNLIATFDASGDGYGSTPGALAGTVTIYPFGATVIDVTADFTQPTTLTALQNCGLGAIPIVTQFTNLSTTSVSNIPVKYSVNGGTAVSEVIAGPIAAGDSIEYTFTATADFSAQNVYELKSWSEMAGDVAASNDTASLVFTNSLTTPLTSATYTNGIESDYEYLSTNMDWIGSGAGFGPSSSTVHSGVLALYLTIGATAPAADYESHAVLPCMDVVTGETYRISYWRKSNDTPAANGMSGIFAGTAQTAAAMTTVVKAYSAITPNAQAGVWEKDSADYVATTTGTMYFSIGGKGTIAATAPTQVNVRIDDVTITKIVTIDDSGLEENTIVLNAYPNPADDVLNFNLNGSATSIEIVSLDGKVVASQKVTGTSATVNISNLTSGIYMYKVTTTNGAVSTNKFVKK